ncbi:MAG: restriction endonuclease subunit S [Christensenellales bacterium]|jgi:type I restriction enzyme S subunit
MGLNKIKIADIAVPFSRKSEIPDLTPYQVSGVNKEKEFFEPSRQVGSDTSNYLVVPPRFFACNLMHVGRDVVLPIAYNHSKHDKYVSPAYTVFHLKENCDILEEYFFMMLKSDERDRFFWFRSDSSVRDGMTWNDFCDIEISVPDRPTQQKYVAVYKAMEANQQSYEQGLEDLKLACYVFVKNIRKRIPSVRIGPYLYESVLKNNETLPLEAVRGLATSKEFISTKANMTGVSLTNYKVVHPRQIAYVPDTSRRGDKVSLAINDSTETILVSSIAVVFGTREDYLLPEYLMLFLTHSEFDRYARYHSWGSAREVFSYEDMQDIKIPIPDIKIQRAVAEIFTVYKKRRTISDELKSLIQRLCPILIRGSLLDGG